MAPQQERAKRTRAAIVESAAVEFGKRGYAAASINTILEGSHATKGAMYFHFSSKEDLARAVLGAATAQYHSIFERWDGAARDPLDTLHAIIVDIARAFGESAILRAEFRLIAEPEFHAAIVGGSGSLWSRAARDLAVRAQADGLIGPGVDPDRFGRVLSAALAGQRFLRDVVADPTSLEELFVQAYELILAGVTTDGWRQRHRSSGWAPVPIPEPEPAI